MLPKCSGARSEPFNAAWTNWSNCLTIPPPGACGGQEPVEKKFTPDSLVEVNLQSLIETRTAGDPDDERIVFTDLTPTRLERELAALETPASDDLIRR